MLTLCKTNLNILKPKFMEIHGFYTTSINPSTWCDVMRRDATWRRDARRIPTLVPRRGGAWSTSPHRDPKIQQILWKCYSSKNIHNHQILWYCQISKTSQDTKIERYKKLETQDLHKVWIWNPLPPCYVLAVLVPAPATDAATHLVWDVAMPIPNHVDGRKGLLDGEHLRRHHTQTIPWALALQSATSPCKIDCKVTHFARIQRKIYWQNPGSSNSAEKMFPNERRIHGSAAPCRVHLQDTNDHLPTLSWTFAAHPVRSGKALTSSCGNCIWFLIQFACEISWTATGCSNLKQTWTPRFPAFEGDALRSLARQEHRMASHGFWRGDRLRRRSWNDTFSGFSH